METLEQVVQKIAQAAEVFNEVVGDLCATMASTTDFFKKASFQMWRAARIERRLKRRSLKRWNIQKTRSFYGEQDDFTKEDAENFVTELVERNREALRGLAKL